MNDKIKVDISEENGTISCRVVVPPYDRGYRVKTRIRTHHIKRLMGERGYSLLDYELQKDAMIHNKKEPPILEATWVFVREGEDSPPPKKKTTTRKKRTTKPKTTEE